MPVESERRRFAECALEPIRTPGSVQSYGAMVITDADGVVVQVSANSGDLLGRDASTLLGSPLSDLIGAGAAATLVAVLDPAAAAQNPTSVTLAGTAFDVIVRAAGDFTVAEFEPTLASSEFTSPAAVYAIALRLARAANRDVLRAETVIELQRLTGFDHVMLYHFHPDAHGEVVAEARVAAMDPYLGLHYPASDIPSQARELYLSKLSRVIASSVDEGVPLLALDGSHETDLGATELRSVSPFHLQFMRNMGQASTLSFSLVHDGTLVGMITCAHRTERRVPYVLRQALEVLANQVALQLNSMARIDALLRQREADAIRAQLIAQVGASDDLAHALLGGTLTVLDLVAADGVTLMLDGHATSLGTVPSADALAAITRSPTVSSRLIADLPQLAAELPAVAGLIMIPLGGEGNYLAWFRREVSQAVQWLGDQTPANRLTPLSPRSSFTAWTEEVAGESVPWAGADRVAVDLCSDIESALLSRAESRLAALAVHDPLTGLPNRRLLMDRLEHALAKYARGHELTVLFIDLDGFKSINDTFGHDAGDAVLVESAALLQSLTRTQDTVARLGGDEFVILCENTTAEEGDVLAARVVAGLHRDVRFDGRFMTVSASIGVAPANLSFSAVEVLRAADAAMYRAKQRGRDRASR